MKTIVIFLLSLISASFISSAQVLQDIDEISPFHEELAAVRKGNSWGFINPEGALVIDYREDLVWTPVSEKKSKKMILRKEPVKYPYFSEGKCLIKKENNGIVYYGYIDTTGKTSIEPEFLNATPFEHKVAIVIKVTKETLGKNDLLDKKVVSYSYDEIVIDTLGAMKTHLRGPEHLILKKEKLLQPPAIQSYLVSENLVADKGPNGKWQLYSLNASN